MGRIKVIRRMGRPEKMGVKKMRVRLFRKI